MMTRVAGLADAAALARLSAQTFRETFGHLYPPEDLEAFLTQAHSVSAWENLLRDPAMRTWVIDEVGYALAGPCQLPHPEVTPGSGELRRLYVVGSRQGSGLGLVLFDEALRWLKAQGREPVWVGVYSENHRALKLYERSGFVPVGEYQFVVGRVRDRELILRRA